MFAAGLLEETRALLARYGPVRALDSLGYRQAISVLNGNESLPKPWPPRSRPSQLRQAAVDLVRGSGGGLDRELRRPAGNHPEGAQLVQSS